MKRYEQRASDQAPRCALASRGHAKRTSQKTRMPDAHLDCLGEQSKHPERIRPHGTTAKIGRTGLKVVKLTKQQKRMESAIKFLYDYMGGRVKIEMTDHGLDFVASINTFLDLDQEAKNQGHPSIRAWIESVSRKVVAA